MMHEEVRTVLWGKLITGTGHPHHSQGRECPVALGGGWGDNHWDRTPTVTKMQPYMKDKSVDKARTKFRLRTEMLEPFKDNFRSRYRTMERGHEEEDPGLRCKDCMDKSPPARDSQVHCLVCPAWSDLREDLDLTDVRCIEDMVIYFQRVLKAREAKSDREKKQRRKEKEEESNRREEERGQKRRRGQ